jgi:integrase
MAQYKRKLSSGDKWWYKFDFQGKNHFSRAIYDTKAEAKKAESDLYTKLNEQLKHPDEEEITLLQAINERLDDVKIKKSYEYYKDSKRYCSKLLEHFGDVNIRTIRKRDMNIFLNKISEEYQNSKKDNYGVNAMLNACKAVFNYAIDNYEINMRNPCKGIEPYAVVKRMKFIPTDEMINEVLSICDEEEKMLINFVDESAARINEPLKVRGEHLLEEHVILQTKKSRYSNIVPRKVPKPKCISHIKIAPEKFLFSRWTDTPKFLQRKVKQLNQRKWCWHSLRHRRASLWLKEGKSLFEIMQLLGHSNLKTTQGYLQLIP